MALCNQVHIYSVDTAGFYNEAEASIHRRMNKKYNFRNRLKRMLPKANEDKKIRFKHLIKQCNIRAKELKELLKFEFRKNNKIRVLDELHLHPSKVVSVFESTLNRIMQIPTNTLSKDIFIVQAYFFEVLEDIILNGFVFEGEKYVCFTASAGQIRTKKTVFIKESILKQHLPNLMCGLTFSEINKRGGININKYLAYLALCNSATDLWYNFDITKTIVVDDMETIVRGTVDFINDETYEITRQDMDVPISHTDGCGMILPSKSRKGFMVRLPWIKGLLVPFPYDKFIRENSCRGVVKDIYGVEHDVLKEDIEVIFTKSQFKMYAYYDSWNHYIENFIKYNCQAGTCNEEEDIPRDTKLNYQMLQTLTDMTEPELKIIADKTINGIDKIGNDRLTMFKVLGITKGNKNKNYLQQAIELYPPLLRDIYTKEVLRQVKKSLVKDGRAGKIDIEGKYTFISPDLYAFCEYLFLDVKEPMGLLQDGEVFCRLYKDKPRLDCLRAPHLWREHAVRDNVVDSLKSEWFVSKSIYISCHDLISKLIQCDFDGDKMLVCADKTIVDIANRNMQGIVPLFYNMAKAGKMDLSNQSIYYGLKTAYTGGNIGVVSNDITKIWNSGNIDDMAMKAIKYRCMESNFTIDYAKTLYKPDRPNEIKTMMKDYTKSKMPRFFIYAKDKDKDKVEPNNGSVVNRLEKIIANSRMKFTSAGVENFQVDKIMKNFAVDLNTITAREILSKYKELDLQVGYQSISKDDEEEFSKNVYVYLDIRQQLLEINSDPYYVTDVIIKHLYTVKNSKHKTTLWTSFGDILIENLKRNIVVVNTYCECCGDVIVKTSNRTKYCDKCWKEKELADSRKYARESMRRKRQNKNVKGLEKT